MFRDLKVTVVVPCYNEEKMVGMTVATMPDIVDTIITVNDGSTDDTLNVLHRLATEDPRVIVLDNDRNHGIGYSLVNGFKLALATTDSDIIGVLAGDAQCDPTYIAPMLEELEDEKLDYVKANRFFHRDALKAMPRYRQFGNIFISLLTKFSTGYYSISDTQNGYGFFTRRIMEKMDFYYIGERYDYENTMLIALSIAGARIKDVPVPAIYGDETSTIKVLPTSLRALRAVWVGFWRRLYRKYILLSFHPVALFLLSGLFLALIGFVFGVVLIVNRVVNGVSPSSGTVMLVVLPLIVGFQLLMTSILMDMNNEGRG
jgi:glycosyltransferase involved in cell wall biosynthesis